MAEQLTYKDSGVDIDAGNYSVKLIKDSVKATYRPEVLGDLGGFGGLFALNSGKYKEPVLVSGTDGVGTKLRLAFMLDKHDTIGQDAVAMCVNDILVQGAEPLFFLDYLAVGKLDPEQVAAVVKGVANACKESGCALIGGETAEMSGFYPVGEYDIAGFAVGVVEKSKVITSERVKEGDVLLGLPSSGVHSNGYSLVRKICFEHKGFKGDEYIDELGKTIGEELLTPTRLYPKTCLPLIEKFDIHGMVHITGGGFYDNIPRALPERLTAPSGRCRRFSACFSSGAMSTGMRCTARSTWASAWSSWPAARRPTRSRRTSKPSVRRSTRSAASSAATTM